jgi:hypothetical protein
MSDEVRMSATIHRQVPVVWQGREAEVDEELAPLILALWKAGIATCNSCQENRPGVVWIEFLTAFDAQEFLDLVAEHPSEAAVGGVPFWETLYGRIMGYAGDQDWEYDTYPHNWAVEEDLVGDEVIERCTGPADIGFFVSVRFPRTDLPLVLKRVLAALEEDDDE